MNQNDVSSQSDQYHLIYSLKNLNQAKCFGICSQMSLCFIVKYLSDLRVCRLYDELASLDLKISYNSTLYKKVTTSKILPRYAGNGYNLINGNPKTNLIDPGFRSAIFDISYKYSQTTPDGSYYIPDYFTSLINISCSYSASVFLYTGMTGYQYDLSLLASTNDSYTSNVSSASFTASSAYQSRKSAFDNNTKIFTDAGAVCKIYSLEIQEKNIYLLISADFNQTINQALKGIVSWQDVINSFGTHYVTSVVMGGRTHLQHKMNRTSYQKMITMGLDVKKLSEIKFANWSRDTSVNYSYYASQLNFFQSMIDETNVVYIGGKPPSSGVSTDWQNVVQTQLGPVMYTIKPITKLFNSIYFPWLTSDEVKNLTDQYTGAVIQYCALLNCTRPIVDPSFPSNVTYTTRTTGTYGTNSGTVFTQNLPSNPILTVRQVIIKSSPYVNNLQFLLSDGVNSYYTGAYGSTSGILNQWDVPTGETITQIEVRAGSYINALTFITNKGTRSTTYGQNSGGIVYTAQIFGNLVSFNGQYSNSINKIEFIYFNLTYEK